MIKPNMASTSTEMDQLVENALGRLTIARAEAPRVLTPIEWLIAEVVEGMV